jgi:chorismate mutase
MEAAMSDDRQGGPESESLEELRERIAALDKAMLDLLAQRVHLAEAVARMKEALHMPLRNPKVEEEVVHRMESACLALSLDKEMGRALADLVIRLSLKAQKPILEK